MTSEAYTTRDRSYESFLRGHQNPDAFGHYYHSDWEIKKFAYKLKESASLLTGIPISNFEDQDFKKTNLGPEWESVFIRQTGDGIDNTLGPFTSVQDANHFLEAGILNHPNISNELQIHHMTVRDLLQKLGTDALRNNLHTNVWINALFADYTCTHTDQVPNGIDCDKWLITDCRFPNEALAIKERNGIVIRVTRPGEEVGEHASETALDNWLFDIVITNDGSIEDLIQKVKTQLAGII